MKTHWRWGAVLLVGGALTGGALASVPEITGIQTIAPYNQVRAMTSPVLVAEVDKGGDPRNLVYRWEIVQFASGAEKLETSQGSSTRVHLWWGAFESNPNALIGRTVRVRLTVRFQDAPEEESVTEEVALPITGVKSPPVPVISGDRGSLSSRLPCGTGCTIGLNAFASTDPDGEAIGHRWGIDAVSPPNVSVTKVGGQGNQFGLIVPPLLTDTNIVVRLRAYSHLHEVDRTDVVYLSSAVSGGGGGGTGNRAPTLSVQSTTVSVTQGQELVLVANATDLDGDNLAFVWTGLDNSTVSPMFVTSERTSSTGWRSTLRYPTAGIAPGTYQFSVQAFEDKTQPLSSDKRFLSVVVTSTGGGGGAPGFFEENRGTCGSNSGPVLLSISPDPRNAAIQYSPGQTARIELVFRDSTQVQIPIAPGIATGIKSVNWDTGPLTQRGITANTSLEAMGPATDAKAILTFLVPSGATGEARVTATAADQEDCATTVAFGINFLSAGDTTPPPQARIRYRTSATGDFITPPGSSVQTGARTIYLDATASTGEGTLTYTWAASGIGGTTLSSTSGQQVTLTIPDGVTGTVNVSLTARDSQNRTGSASLAFNVTQVANPPQASISSWPGNVESGEEFEVVGTAETGGGSKNFTYQWSATTAAGQPLENLFSSNARVRIKAPALEEEQEESFVTVQLIVVEDGVPSQAATVQVPVTRPRLSFSQVAVGWIDAQRRFETSIVLVNDSDGEAFGEMVFANNEFGEDWAVLVDGQDSSWISFNIPPGGAREFLLTGDEVEFGWMRVTSSTPLAGHLFYRVVGAGNRILREVPILPVRGRSFRTALGAGAHEFVATALVNLGRDATRFRVVAREDESPDIPLATRWIELLPGQHLARYLSELYRDHSAMGGFPPGFLGGSVTVEIEDPSGVFGATIIRTTEDGLPLSILPVATRR